MEIERKFTVKKMPENLEQYSRHIISQAYLCREPVVRIRQQDNEFYITYKGKGMMAREEYNLPLTKEAYEHLLLKADGNIISKTRYLIPIASPKFKEESNINNNLMLVAELDVFDAPFAPLVMAEVEFPDMECADSYIPEDWFLEDVTPDKAYHNVNMAYSKLDF